MISVKSEELPLAVFQERESLHRSQTLLLTESKAVFRKEGRSMPVLAVYLYRVWQWETSPFNSLLASFPGLGT